MQNMFLRDFAASRYKQNLSNLLPTENCGNPSARRQPLSKHASVSVHAM